MDSAHMAAAEERSLMRNSMIVMATAAILVAALLFSGCAAPSSQPAPGTPVPFPSATRTLHPSVTAAPVPAAPSPTAAPSLPPFSHVFIIVMENKEYDEIIGSSQAPYINSIARNYATATRYYAVTHPSLPNYLALVSGSTQGMTTDCATCSFDAPNIVDQLETRQKTWVAYAEDMPSPCFNGAAAGGLLAAFGRSLYVRKHNPFMYFKDISENPQRCANVVPLSGFADRLAKDQLPDFVWITPNLQHDMHDGSVHDGDKWLSSFVPPILASNAWLHGGVLFIIWDEGTSNAGCCGNAAGGHTPALVIAPQGKRGYQSSIAYTHYSLLRTVEDAWHLGHLDHAGDPGTLPMADFFR